MKKYSSLISGITLLLFILFWLPQKLVSQNIKAIGAPIDFPTGNEYDPSLIKDGNFLAFISDKSGQYKIYLSEKQGESWSDPIEITSINNFNNGSGNIRYPSFNYDGSILYFNADFYKDSSDVDIFYSKKNVEEWSEPISIGSPITTNFF